MIFRFIHRSSFALAASYIFPGSVIIQVYASGHILYYKWKYCREDNQVHIFYITPGGEGDAERQQQPTNICNSNTTAYNKLLFEVKSMINSAIILISVLLTRYIIGNLQEKGYDRALSLSYYIQDWSPGLTVTVVFPFCFYKCIPEARLYFKKMFCKC